MTKERRQRIRLWTAVIGLRIRGLSDGSESMADRRRNVADCQIVQFVFSFGLSGWMLREHLFGSGCTGIWGWCFNAAFNASLLALFSNFHSKNYVKKPTREDGKKSD